MVFAYVFCMSFGIFIARNLKQYYWWFPLHIIIQMTGVICAFAGLFVAIAMVAYADQFSTVHSWFGISALSLTFLSPILGWAADLIYDPKRSSVPIWPDLIHRTLGRLTVLVAYVAVYLGMADFGVSIVIRIAFLVFLSYYIFLYVFLEVYRHFMSKEIVDHN